MVWGVDRRIPGQTVRVNWMGICLPMGVVHQSWWLRGCLHWPLAGARTSPVVKLVTGALTTTARLIGTLPPPTPWVVTLTCPTTITTPLFLLQFHVCLPSPLLAWWHNQGWGRPRFGGGRWGRSASHGTRSSHRTSLGHRSIDPLLGQSGPINLSGNVHFYPFLPLRACHL